jgi:arsenite methyltransferase
VSGAISPDEVKRILSDVGFREITISPKEQSEEIIRAWNVADSAEKVVFSAYIQAEKPGRQAGS